MGGSFEAILCHVAPGCSAACNRQIYREAAQYLNTNKILKVFTLNRALNQTYGTPKRGGGVRKTYKKKDIEGSRVAK